MSSCKNFLIDVISTYQPQGKNWLSGCLQGFFYCYYFSRFISRGSYLSGGKWKGDEIRKKKFWEFHYTD
jgi:hypothetical protein